MITLTAQFTMRVGKVPAALKLVQAVKRQAEKEQAGTLVYLVHRVIGKNGRETRTLFFYERYRREKALQAHLNSSSWQAIETQWSSYFEGGSSGGIESAKLKRIAAFARPGAIPSGHRRKPATKP